MCLTIGRVGIDLYPLQDNVGLKDVETFSKSLGGSPTNVAIAAARHGRRTAVITRTGPDGFGEFVHEELTRFGVSGRSSSPTVPGLLTPLAFCENYPPDHFPLQFYRLPIAPDLVIKPEELDLAAIADARIFWSTVTGSVRRSEPVRASRRLAGPGSEDAHHPGPGLPARCSGPTKPRPASRSGPRCRTSPWRSATRRSARSRSAKPNPAGPRRRCSTRASKSRSSSRDPRACWA